MPLWPTSSRPLRVVDAELVGAWGLGITWNDGHSTGIYSTIAAVVISAIAIGIVAISGWLGGHSPIATASGSSTKQAQADGFTNP